MGIGVAAALMANGVGFGAAITATYGVVGAAAIRIGASLLISAATNALFGGRDMPKAQDIKRELSQPTTEPTYRFVYGETRATGTPAGTPVRGKHIWGCWILNSRPSVLDAPELYLDERLVEWDGDPFDFSGPGGYATNDPFKRDEPVLGESSDPPYERNHVRFWIGRGDQTSPPQKFLDDVPYGEGDEDLWKATDAWKGRTVIWMRLRAGENEDRQERWPSTPPMVAVEGKWCAVWDPRDEAQDGDDESTWGWSDNHALCVLDALRNNPIRKYRDINLHMQSFIDAANASDEVVERKSGTEPRYRAAGTLTFESGEIEDQINPLVLSGAANLIRIGGQLGLAAGVWRAPQVELSYFLGEGFSAPDMVPGSELVNELRVSYLSPDRGYETAELSPWPIPGALAQDGGVPAVRDIELSFCPSATQAMRVRKINGLRMRRQERIEGGTLPPEAFDLVAGANVSVSLPAPYDVLDGTYEIESLHPAMDPTGREGMALRMPSSLVKTDATIYDWDAETEEEDIILQPYNGERKGVQLPGAINVSTGDGANLDTGGTILPRVRFAFDPSLSSSADSYRWQFRVDGGDWQSGGSIDAEIRDGNNQVFGYLEGAAGTTYDIRVRTVSPLGKSGWVEYIGATPTVSVTLNPPELVEITAGTGEISVTFQTANDPQTEGMEIWGADTDTADPINDATLLGTFSLEANRSADVTETGLSSGQTRYYFARARGPYNSASAFSPSASETAN